MRLIRFNKQNHEKMIVWQMADKLDSLVQKILNKIPRSEFRLKGQIDIHITSRNRTEYGII